MFDKSTQIVRGNQIVGVYEANPFSFRENQSSISCLADTPISLVNHTNSFILLSELIADFTAAVRAAVIDENELEITIGLAQDAADAGREVLLNLIHGNNDADGGHRISMG